MKEHVGKKKPATQKAEWGLIKNHIIPMLGNLHINELNIDILRDFYPKAAARTSNSTANLMIALISHFWNWCEKHKNKYLPLNTNPCKHVERKKNAKMDYAILDIPDYKKFFAAINDGIAGKAPHSPRAFRAIKILAMMGGRTSEITQLRKDEIDFDNSRLNLRDSKTGAKKLMISAAVVEELHKAMAESEPDSPFVFPATREGVNKGIDPRKAFAWVLDRARLPHMRKHDLRHSYISAAGAMGESTLAISKVVGHASPTTTEIYLHATDRRKLETANKIAAAIAG